MQVRTVLEHDVSGKDGERVSLCNFATDDASPDSICVEKYVRVLSSSADQAYITGTEVTEVDRSTCNLEFDLLQYSILHHRKYFL